jgi:hypothetical protein
MDWGGCRCGTRIFWGNEEAVGVRKALFFINIYFGVSLHVLLDFLYWPPLRPAAQPSTGPCGSGPSLSRQMEGICVHPARAAS